MNDEDNNKEMNPLEKQLKEINEWQKNANNPGYFIGSGKVPLPMKNFYRTPGVMLTMGILLLIITVCNLIGDFSYRTVIIYIIMLVISCNLIIRGIRKLLKKTK